MRSETFAADTIGRLLRRRGIATMEELKAALGSSVDMTVFRKLRELSYLASYSHRGKYYALEETAQFDERGLWACREARFSRFGSLVDTLEVFVARSTGGSSRDWRSSGSDGVATAPTTSSRMRGPM